MTKFLATSILALTMGATAAQAGGLNQFPSEPVIAAPAPVAVARDWTGGYVGLQLGGTDGRLGMTETGNPANTGTVGLRGLNGGVFAGYNWHTGGNLVLGVEGDIAGSRANGTTLTTGGNTVDGRIRSSGSLRARAGVALGDTLLYGTAGASRANYGIIVDGGPEVTGARTGWTAGIGIEQAFSNNLTGRLEVRHADYGSFTAAGFDNNLRTNEVRAGLALTF